MTVVIEEMESGVDVPGLPPLPPSSLLKPVMDKKNPNYMWFRVPRQALRGGRWYHRQHGCRARAVGDCCHRLRTVHARSSSIPRWCI